MSVKHAGRVKGENRTKERKRLQAEQKATLLTFLPASVLRTLAAKNNIHVEEDTSQADMTALLSVLTGTSIVNQIPKSYLEVFLNQQGVAPPKYVAQMRTALLDYWENERTENLIDLTIDDKEKIPTKVPQTAPQLAIQHTATANQGHSTIAVASTKPASVQVMQNHPPSPVKTISMNNQRFGQQEDKTAQAPTLADQFVSHFYSQLRSADPCILLGDNMFSPSAVGYLFLFTPDGSSVLAEKKAEGIQEISQLLPMLARFSFSVASKEDNFDEYGMLYIRVKGTIVNGNDCVGIFTHFFSFFKTESGKYAIRECSFHVKTHHTYQPLAHCLPYHMMDTSRICDSTD